MINNWLDLIYSKLCRWGEYLVRMLPNLLLAVLVMIAFIFIARLFRKVSGQIVHRLSKSESVSGLTSAIVYTLVVAVGLMISLKILKLDQAVSSLLAGVGIIGLALGFAFQDLTSNFISGAFIVFKRPFDVGHIIDTNGFVGRVDDIQLRATTIQTMAGLHVIIPNKDIFQKAIINYTLTTERRVEVEFFIPNTVDLSDAARALHQALQRIDEKSRQEEDVYFSQVEEGKTKVYISLWTSAAEPDRFVKVRHQVILAMTNAVKELTAVKP